MTSCFEFIRSIYNAIATERPDTPQQPQNDKTAVSSKPIKPVSSKPVKPIPQKPVKPVPQKPIKPIPTKPIKPIATKPVKPISPKPVKPIPTKPVKPVSPKPIKPVPLPQPILPQFPEIPQKQLMDDFNPNSQMNSINIFVTMKEAKPNYLTVISIANTSSLVMHSNYIKTYKNVYKYFGPNSTRSTERLLGSCTYLTKRTFPLFIWKLNKAFYIWIDTSQYSLLKDIPDYYGGVNCDDPIQEKYKQKCHKQAMDRLLKSNGLKEDNVLCCNKIAGGTWEQYDDVQNTIDISQFGQRYYPNCDEKNQSRVIVKNKLAEREKNIISTGKLQPVWNNTKNLYLFRITGYEIKDRTSIHIKPAMMKPATKKIDLKDEQKFMIWKNEFEKLMNLK